MPRFSDSASLIEAKSRAVLIAREYPHALVEPVHLLKSVLASDDSPAIRATELLGLNIHEIRAKLDAALEDLPRVPPKADSPSPSGALKAALQLAQTECEALGEERVQELHVLLALTSFDGGLPAELRKQLGFRRGTLLAAIKQLKISAVLETGPTLPGVGAPGQTPSYCEDLTLKAHRGEVDPMRGRRREIARLVEILARRTKNNALIMGEPGTGKTALVEGLAQLIDADEAPPHLAGFRIYALDLAGMVAGAKYKGEFEERFKKLLTEMAARPKAILFIDEIHTLLGVGRGGGGVDAGNILKPALARGELRVIGATTTAEFRESIERDAAFHRRFEMLRVEEPDDAAALEMIGALAPRYAKHHGVEYRPEALEAAVKLSRRYLSTRFLPDKAVDLIDAAGADVRILAEVAERFAAAAGGDAEASARTELLDALDVRGIPPPIPRDGDSAAEALRLAAEALTARVVDTEAIARRLSLATGIPVQRMNVSERERLMRLEEHLHRRIIGQEGPIGAVANAIRRSRTGLKQRPNQPIGRFLFLGPTGTGKTELAKALAEFLFNDEQAMIRIDMTEYKSEYSIKRLTGADPGLVGYKEGGVLTEALKRRPYSVVLFDEIDKAEPGCWDIFVSIFDDGRITDGKGNTVDCSNTVLVLTSNYAGSWIADQFREKGCVDPQELHQRLLAGEESNRGHTVGFRPELLNRFDDYQVFHPLSRDQVRKIVDLLVDRLIRMVSQQGVTLCVTGSARDEICKRGYDPDMGARPVQRTMDRLIGDALALRLAGEEDVAGLRATVDVVKGEILVHVERPVTAGVAAANAAERG